MKYRRSFWRHAGNQPKNCSENSITHALIHACALSVLAMHAGFCRYPNNDVVQPRVC
jgi:hypothetical protein